jgi:hypothetical protein
VAFPDRSGHHTRIIEYHPSVPGGLEEDEVPWDSRRLELVYGAVRHAEF